VSYCKKYDAILLTVAHEDFYEYTLDDFNKISKEKLVLLDLKNVYSFATWNF
jgi:UDP-N-acetyl-D-mannosaminuronate dehydrogenase